MAFKRFASLVIAMAFVASLCAISVSANGFTSDNRTEGTVTEVKGTKNDGTWARTHTGSSGTTRTSVTMKAKTDVSGAIGIVNVYDTSNSGYSCKYVHSAFRVNCTAGWQIRIRNGSSGNIQWMNFSKDGGISANSSGTNKGVDWTPGTDHKIDIVADVNNGVGYLYIDKKLASFSTNLQRDGKWYGYLLYTAGSWETDDQLVWRYGYSKNSIQHVLYNDTQDYSVCIEDVLLDSGIVDAPTGDSSLFYANERPRDYFASSNDGSLTYANDGSVTIEGDYYNEADGNAQNFMRMLSGFYPEGDYHVSIGGSVLYISYTQVVNSANRAEIRIRNNYENKNGNRMTLVPTSDGKTRVSSFSNTSTVLDKDWGEAVDVGIVVDLANHKAYSIVDGVQLGGAYDYFKGYNNFQDLRMYLNGTEDNETASVTISNWSMKLYDDAKDVKGLIAEIEGLPVYFASSDTLEVEDGSFGMAVTAKGTLGADPINNAKMYAAVYDAEGKLLDITSWDYADGVTNDEIAFDGTGDEDTIKTFCWGIDADNQEAYARANVFDFADYTE